MRASQVSVGATAAGGGGAADSASALPPISSAGDATPPRVSGALAQPLIQGSTPKTMAAPVTAHPTLKPNAANFPSRT